MREAILREAEVTHCGSGITAADDGERTSCGSVDQTWLRPRCGSESRTSNTPIGPFQTTVLESTILSWKSFWESGPMSRPILSAGMRRQATTFRSDVLIGLREDRVHHDIGRQHEFDAVLLSALDVALDGLDLILFQQGGADLEALALRKV